MGSYHIDVKWREESASAIPKKDSRFQNVGVFSEGAASLYVSASLSPNLHVFFFYLGGNASDEV